jgi:hypothetical protein
VDDVAQKLNEQLGKTVLMTGAQFALRHIDESQKHPKAKCPFIKIYQSQCGSKKTHGTDVGFRLLGGKISNAVGN